MRKAELIELIRTSLRESQPIIGEPIMGSSEPSRVIELPNDNKLTKRQRKRNGTKAAKIKKKTAFLRNEIDNLISQRESIEEKVAKATKSTSAKVKGKRIHPMKREAVKLANLIEQKTKELKTIETNPISQEIVRTSQQSKENRRTRRKKEDINRKIRRAKDKTKRNLTIKRNLLRLQLIDATPRLIEGAFGGNYSKYRINGIEGMDLPTFLSKIRSSITNVLRKETSQRAIHLQTTTWIRFMKGDEVASLAFNSRMTPVYYLNDINLIVQSMINHMVQQVENSALRDSKFVIDSIMYTDI